MRNLEKMTMFKERVYEAKEQELKRVREIFADKLKTVAHVERLVKKGEHVFRGEERENQMLRLLTILDDYDLSYEVNRFKNMNIVTIENNNELTDISEGAEVIE